jgi:hypothetical protein
MFLQALFATLLLVTALLDNSSADPHASRTASLLKAQNEARRSWRPPKGFGKRASHQNVDLISALQSLDDDYHESSDFLKFANQ